MEYRINVTIGLDCETLRFLTNLFVDKKQHDEVIAAGKDLQASTEALQAAMDKTKGVS